ncbi:hypothetical protein SAMN05518672_103462 [Chitinophaga sp. CF118]|nr:hypothetical protein [Chitinophaga sp. CF118]SFD84147.1 hypothetical protein SAMN05518672_103462 [Chitinophaga sp. CF118]
MSEEEEEEKTTTDVAYTFDGYDIEVNVKVVLNPVNKPGKS